MLHAVVIEKTKTHIVCSIIVISPENHAVYEMMWENTLGPDRPPDNDTRKTHRMLDT